MDYSAQIDAELEKLPKAFRSAVYSLAYDSGHAYGEHEVLSHVQDMVYALLNPCQEYAEQLRQEWQIDAEGAR